MYEMDLFHIQEMRKQLFYLRIINKSLTFASHPPGRFTRMCEKGQKWLVSTSDHTAKARWRSPMVGTRAVKVSQALLKWPLLTPFTLFLGGHFPCFEVRYMFI